MSNPSPQRSMFLLGWLKQWSWTECIVVGAAALSPFVVLSAGRDWGWLAGVFALVAFVILNVVVHRHGGWNLLGPHFYYDVVRLARRGRSTVLRVAFIIALFLGLAFVYENTPIRMRGNLNEFAQVSERFAYSLFIVQNAAILVLTPAYLASAIAEEKERRTLELLFTTHLSNTEIILGKLTSRIIHLMGFVIAGFPVLCLVQFWGGIDMYVIAGNLVNTLLNIITLGSMCLLASVLAKTVAGAVMTCYAIVLPTGFCCMAALRGFPFVLQDARSGGHGNVTIQDLGILFVVHLVATGIFLAIAIAALREREPLGPPPRPPRRRERKPGPDEPRPLEPAPRRADAEPDRADLFAVPYTLPPMTDEPLMWKERYLGGPPMFFSPIVLVPALPFLGTGLAIMVFWFVRALFMEQEEYERTLRTWTVILKFFYYVFLAIYTIGVAWRAGAAVARERQQQTLEPLLLLPIERREILTAKLIGCLWRGWPWLILIGCVIVFGTLAGVFHPFSAVLLCLVPWPMILFIATLGLMLSIGMRTVLRANLVMVLTPLFLIGCSSIGLEACTFSRTRPEDPYELQNFIVAGALFVFFACGALGCWCIALRMFENRSVHAEHS